MDILFETERLMMRQLKASDMQSFFDLNNDDEVLKYTGDLPFDTVEAAGIFLKNYSHYRQHGYGRWAVILKQDHAFAGWCGLKYNADIDEVDLGFRFFKKYWNNGFATEAAKACIKYGFEQYGLTKIIGRVMNANEASINVLKKAGMSFEKQIDFDGQAGSCYSIIKRKPDNDNR